MTPFKLFEGTPVKMKLISNCLCYGPCPEPEEEIEQRLTIKNNYMWLTRYAYGEGGDYKLLSEGQGRLALENGEAILNEVAAFFSTDKCSYLFATDVGTWELTLTNDAGEEFKYYGSVVPLVEELSDICEDIRQRMDMPYLFLFDGEERQDKITRLTVEYNRVTKIIPKEPIEAGVVTWDYAEKLTIDRASETFEYFRRIGTECDVSWKYHVSEGVSNFLDDTYVGTFENIQGNPPDAIDDPMEQKTYKITIEFAHWDTRVIEGTFDRLGLPEEWMSFAGDVKGFMSFYGDGEMFDPKYYLMQKRSENDVIYLSVAFGEGYKTYYYQTTDHTIAVDDLVVVPVGTEGKERIVKVKKKEYYKPDAVPMPLDRVKFVIEKFVPPADGELIFHCPVMDKDIDDDECYCYCIEGFNVPTDEEAERCDKICENCRYHCDD